MNQRQKLMTNTHSQDSINKEQINRLKQKVHEYQKKLQYVQKQQLRLRQLQKANSDNATRLMQCVSNVRDLLHSNKKLREQLQKQKALRQQIQKKFKILKGNLGTQSKASSPTKRLGLTDLDDSQPFGIQSLRGKNVHRSAKLDKLSRLKLNSKRYSTQANQVSPQTQPITKKNSNELKQLGTRYGLPSFVIKQVQNRSSNKKPKLSKSMDMKKQEKKYVKAQLRRKKSLKESQQKFQLLQYKPIKQPLIQKQ